VVCNGSGSEIVINADDPDPTTDVQGDCLTPSCANGEKSQTPVGFDTPCSIGGVVCTAAGACVACNEPADCGSAGVCKVFQCSSNNCVSQNVGGGDDPNGNCNDQGAASCGQTGACDGNGSCALYPGGTQCAAPSCNANTDQFTGQKTCNGSGACNGPSPMICPNNYACAGSACNTTCMNDGHCQDGYACAGGNCREAPGSACGGGGECASGFCVDGVCCTTSSCPTCSSCNLNGAGTCQNHPSGQQDPTGCNGGGMACNGSQQCKKVNGQMCPGGATECVSGICRDGRCCVSQCDTECYDCDVAGHLGDCYFTPAGVDDGACNGSQDCNGAGVCQ
jgi:hypothetical protein